MSSRKFLIGIAIAWLIAITLLHAALNLHWFTRATKTAGGQFKIPHRLSPGNLSSHLPGHRFHQQANDRRKYFDPVRFNGWPELKEAYLSGYTPATFILAPMAMALREQGVPIKIVYLGHRDGSAVMVHKDSNIWRMEDLRGKKIAVPNRYSNQRLLIFRALKQAGMTIKDIELVEMPPPDMPAALYAKAVDAISSGEPFMGQTELDGYGRVLWLTKDVWPNFISCVLAVHEDMIKNHRDVVQRLVDGIAKSGKWIDASMDHRMEAAQFVGQQLLQSKSAAAFVRPEQAAGPREIH